MKKYVAEMIGTMVIMLMGCSSDYFVFAEFSYIGFVHFHSFMENEESTYGFAIFIGGDTCNLHI